MHPETAPGSAGVVGNGISLKEGNFAHRCTASSCSRAVRKPSIASHPRVSPTTPAVRREELQTTEMVL